MSDIESLTRQALADIAAAATPDALEALRVALLGKQGSVTAQLKALGALPASERKAAGEAINRARDALGAALAARKAVLEEAALDARLATETIDVTLPGRDAARGGLHPVSRTMERIAEIFGRLGYVRADGPEIEDDWHNFEALNFPPHHPARAMHDTFYFPPDSRGDARLLRTHTSGVQVRYMLNNKPPLRMIALGKVYRSDSDQTHRMGKGASPSPCSFWSARFLLVMPANAESSALRGREGRWIRSPRGMTDGRSERPS